MRFSRARDPPAWVHAAHAACARVRFPVLEKSKLNDNNIDSGTVNSNDIDKENNPKTQANLGAGLVLGAFALRQREQADPKRDRYRL